MDNNNKKQQQSYTRPSKACLSADSSSRKSSTDLQLNKPWPRNSHRREQPLASRNDSQRNSKQQHPSAKVRPNVDKRPRQRGGSGAGGGNDRSTHDTEDFLAAGSGLATVQFANGATTSGGAMAKNMHTLDYELNSIYAPGNKKQNLNHLLNFQYSSRESDYPSAMGLNVFGRNNGNSNMHRYYQSGATGGGKKHKYNKEQFLQANFQFVIKSSAKPKLTASPDTLIDWSLIEQINIQTTEEPQCPICLYPPIAAKLTRCGHAYCWPCLLHYLALSDKSWRKCPICYEAIHIADLKSTTIVQQRQVSVGDAITFHLMRRKKGSMYIEKFKTAAPSVERYPQVSKNDEAKLFLKFLIAKRGDILDIIEREQRELMADEDASSPEYVFVQQALDLLNERRDKLGEVYIKEEEEEVVGVIQKVDNVVEIVEGNGQFEINEIEEESAAAISADDITTVIPITSSDAATIGVTTAKYYYFYQSDDGQNIFLHPLNVKMLQACYGTLDRGPLIINARVLQKEQQSMDESHRRKFTCLGHLPLTCQFAVVEVDLQPPIVTGGILLLFKEDILFRKKERQRREREECKREKQINEINDRQMGKFIASTANLNINSSYEFPSWGFEEPLVSGVTDACDNAVDFPPPPAAAKTAAIAAPKRHVASYSTVAVVGESPQMRGQELWPELASPPAATTTSTNSYAELSIWGRNNANIANNINNRAASDRSSECDSIDMMAANAYDSDAAPTTSSTMRTELGDVLAIAISQKKQQNSNVNGGGNKKGNKKTKKMLPLFSTGINYNGK